MPYLSIWILFGVVIGLQIILMTRIKKVQEEQQMQSSYLLHIDKDVCALRFPEED